MLLLFSIRVDEWPPRLTVRVFIGRVSIWLCVSFPFGFEGGKWDLIILISDYCLSIYPIIIYHFER